MLQVLTESAGNFNSYLFRRPVPEGEKSTQKSPEGSPEDEKMLHQALFCAACRHRISYTEASCERQGSHEHMQVNPHGVTFVFGCFSVAPGVIGVGMPTAEYSWFPGYEWQIVLCEHCQIHLGWQFASAQDQFFALLRNMLRGD